MPLRVLCRTHFTRPECQLVALSCPFRQQSALGDPLVCAIPDPSRSLVVMASCSAVKRVHTTTCKTYLWFVLGMPIVRGSRSESLPYRAGDADFCLAAQRRTGSRGGHVYSQRLGQCGCCRVARSGPGHPTQTGYPLIDPATAPRWVLMLIVTVNAIVACRYGRRA
jgi:hypothetical protein